VSADLAQLRAARLPRSFYLHPTVRVARDLLGCVLVRRAGRRVLAARIVEVEAYLGAADPAAHTFRGKTERNSVMFLEGGHLYVYFTYGMHFCANVVTEREGVGHAVLLRAAEPILGEPIMRERRGPRGVGVNLTNGPAKLAQAFGFGRAENGADLLSDDLFISRIRRRTERVVVARRIGIRVGTDEPLRFFLEGNPWVSRFE
jgi:DNA-3-methyladenine glycosylase